MDRNEASTSLLCSGKQRGRSAASPFICSSAVSIGPRATAKKIVDSINNIRLKGSSFETKLGKNLA